MALGAGRLAGKLIGLARFRPAGAGAWIDCRPLRDVHKRSPQRVDRRISLDQALDRLKQRYGNQDFELIGYSGGAALALLLAARRDDIAQVQTLAGNLNPRLWVNALGLSPLHGSLEPLDQAPKLARVAQRHLLGQADRSVPASLYPTYRQALGTKAVCVQSVSLPGVTHDQGWLEAWQYWRDQPLSCASPGN
ncbi:hypothetical protein EMIT048CA2_120030 [Pseudomonas chlororaphis]